MEDRKAQKCRNLRKGIEQMLDRLPEMLIDAIVLDDQVHTWLHEAYLKLHNAKIELEHFVEPGLHEGK